MLQKFFAFFIIFIIFFVAFIFIEIVIPIWRFMTRAVTVTQLYDIFKEILQMECQIEGKIELPYGNYKLEFENLDEAYIELEKLVQDALKYYDKLGWITLGDDTLNAEKDELIHIYSEIRTSRWKNQGI